MRSTATLSAVLCTLLASSAHAFVAPLSAMDETYFVEPSTDFRVEMVDVHIEQQAGAPSSSEWFVDAELAIRRVSISSGPAILALLDDETFTGQTVAYVDGALVETDVLVIRQNPARPEHTYSRARRLVVPVSDDRASVVRIRMRTTGTIDALGQIFVELPTHALGLFEGTVTSGTIHLQFLGRPLGFQSTLAGSVTYDAPIGEVTWRLREWSPRIPFRTSFMTSWSALLLVAEVEGCPDPWRVVRAVTGGEIDELRGYVGAHDGPTLEFCGNLPEILHGRWFTSEQTREQLSGMTLDRYVTGAQVVSLYAPNSDFDEEQLEDAEAIYARALRSVLSARE